MIYTRGRAHLDTVTLEISVGEPPEQSASPVPQPPSPRLTAVQAVVTGRCNLSCDYCNVRLLGLGGKDMDRPAAERVVELAAEAPADRVVMVTGGEPLLVPETTMWILQKVDPPKVLFTNGTLIDRRTAEELRRLEVSPVVSMDGMADAHDPLRCGSWKRAARGLDLLREAGVPYGISAVVSRRNLEGIADHMLGVWKRFRPIGMGFNIVHWTPEGFHPPSGEEYARAMEEVFRTALAHGIFTDQIARRIEPLVTGSYRHRDCSAMGGKVVLGPGGRVSNCISSEGMSDWSRRTPAFMEECRGCHAAGICGGGCAWDGIQLGGDGPDPRHCVWVKRVLDLFLEDVEAGFGEGPVSREALGRRYAPLLSRDTSPVAGSVGHPQ